MVGTVGKQAAARQDIAKLQVMIIDTKDSSATAEGQTTTQEENHREHKYNMRNRMDNFNTKSVTQTDNEDTKDKPIKAPQKIQTPKKGRAANSSV